MSCGLKINKFISKMAKCWLRTNGSLENTGCNYFTHWEMTMASCIRHSVSRCNLPTLKLILIGKDEN